MIVAAIPVTAEGQTTHLGRAPHMAVAHVENGEITSWTDHDVQWDVLHDQGEHGQHHARIVTFMRDNGVQCVVVGGIGQPMIETLGKLGVEVLPATSVDPKKSVLDAVGAQS